MASALGLLAGTLVLLYLGHFIQFDDTSGFGSEKEVLPLGIAAGFAATASLVVVCFETTLRRLFGGVVLLLVVLVGILNATLDRFRFLWAGGEGELWYFLIVLGMLALVLTTPPLPAAPAPAGANARVAVMSGWARGVAYIGVVVLVVLTSFNLGISHFESTSCSAPDFDGECDLAVLEGLLWAAAAFLAAVVLAAVLEALVRKRQTSSTE